MHYVPPTTKQLSYLQSLRKRKGIHTPLPKKMDKYEASLLIGELTGRSKAETDAAYVNTWQMRKMDEAAGRELAKRLAED